MFGLVSVAENHREGTEVLGVKCIIYKNQDQYSKVPTIQCFIFSQRTTEKEQRFAEQRGVRSLLGDC